MLRPLLGLSFLLIALNGTAFSQRGYGGALRECRTLETMNSLQLKTRGRKLLAETKDPRALAHLIKVFEQPGTPAEQVRYLMTGLCAKYFRRLANVPVLDAWRKRHPKPEHTWLWYRTLEIHAENGTNDELEAIARDKKADIFHRAAAIEALASMRNKELLALIPELLDRPPKKVFERTLLTESLASLLLGCQKQLGTEEFMNAAYALISQLEDKKVEYRTKLTIVRILGKILNTQSIVFEGRPWRNQVRAGRNKDSESESYGTGFFNLQATGQRIVYVIDCSDSMCKPVDESLRKRGGVTGVKKDKKEGKPGFIPREEDISWHRVKNRFDLAREHIKVSLRKLGDKRQFCVILFGDKAEPLPKLLGMRPATKKNVDKALKQLYAIKIKPATTLRPDGRLLGKTNLHGGLRYAFKLTKKGFTKKPEYIDEKTFFEGPDTIFLLSDGAPTWDDFEGQDKPRPEDKAGDPESGIAVPKVGLMNYFGPYQDADFLVDDLRRLNLFRKVEILSVGLGEARMDLLKRISKLGLGEAVQFGKK